MDDKYTMLSRLRSKELLRAQMENNAYLDELEALYGYDTVKEILRISRETAKGFFIWSLMDVQQVLAFSQADENRGLIVDETGQRLEEFIDDEYGNSDDEEDE